MGRAIVPGLSFTPTSGRSSDGSCSDAGSGDENSGSVASSVCTEKSSALKNVRESPKIVARPSTTSLPITVVNTGITSLDEDQGEEGLEMKVVNSGMSKAKGSLKKLLHGEKA